MNPDIRRTIDLLTRPGQVIEIRTLGDTITSGYYNQPGELARVAEILDSPEVQGVYITLNPVRPELLARRANRVKSRLGRSDPSTSDADILCRYWLPIDIDPIRPSGISSSDAEHTAALQRADDIAAFLRDLGFPYPISADSGNGGHLLYAIVLPNDPASLQLLQACLSSLDIRFSDDICKVDTANVNAARIWKLYGTMAHKGDSLPDRPHRRSALLNVPDIITPVSWDLLIRLGSLYPAAPQQSSAPENSRKSIDLAAWLNQHLPGFRQKPYLDGTIFLLDTCPFSSDHTDGAYAIQFANGAIFAGCHHTSCGGGTQRWQELRDWYEKPSGSRKMSGSVTTPGLENGRWNPSSVKQPDRRKNGRPPADPVQIPGDTPESDDPSFDPVILTDAEEILKNGDPLGYMLLTFGLDHEGDRIVAQCLLMSLASRLVLNSKGLHVSITGDSGKGKSHTIDTILRQVPSAYRLGGRISEKALFYMTGLQPGTVIALDDHELSDQMQEILKGVTTSFSHPFVYHTVSKDRMGQTCTIPERCVWWLARVDGSGDDQVYNRMLTCWIDDSENQDQMVLTRTLHAATLPPVMVTGERRENLVCQAIWEQIEPVYVIIPYGDRIRFKSAENRRNPDMFLDLIRSHACLRQSQREELISDGIRCIIATEADFHAAGDLFASLNGSSGGQTSKLTRREAELLTAITALGEVEFSIPELQQKTGFSYSTVHKLLNGSTSRGNLYSGLLEKCPAIACIDRAISSNTGSTSTQRRSRIYTWDPALSDRWSCGGTVWLARVGGSRTDPDDSDDPPSDGSSHEPSVADPDPDCGIAENECSLRKNAEDFRNEKTTNQRDNSDTQVQYLDSTDSAEDREIAAPPCSSSREPSGMTDIPHSAHMLDPANEQRPIPERVIDFSEELSATKPPDSACCSKVLPDPRDFIAVEGWPVKIPCMVCGRPYSLYRERPGRIQREGLENRYRMLCAGCYEAAKVSRSLTIRTIPGLIDTRTMHRTTLPSGRCSICQTGSAVWSDPKQQIAICETCYQREKTSGRDTDHPGESFPGGCHDSD